MMFLYFNGCSYTKGKGIDGNDQDRINKRFSTLVSSRLGADHHNDAKAGSSNDGIVYRTFEWMQNNTCDQAVILMTHAARMDLSINGVQPNRKTLMPGYSYQKNCDTKFYDCTPELANKMRLFYDNFYTDQVGAINFYKNRYLLEQFFEKRGIPLLLLQFTPVPCQETNPFKTLCKGDLPLVQKTFWNNFELSPSIKTILGRRGNKEYYYSEDRKEVIGHFNSKGHDKLADWIVDKLTSTI